MPIHDLFAIRYAWHPEGHSDAEMAFGGNPELRIEGMDFFIWVIVTEAGKPIVVDTGFYSGLAKRVGHSPLIEPREGIQMLGFDPAKVEDVVVTHAHYDHTGNLKDFPNARFHFGTTEMAAVTGPLMTHPQTRAGFGKRDVSTLVGFVYDDRLRFLSDEDVVLPGIRNFIAPGHTTGQLALEIDTSRGPVILTSDAVHIYSELETERPFPVFHDMSDMIMSYRKIKKRALRPDLIVPGHDADVMRRYPAASPDLEGKIVRLDRNPVSG
jgi:glyoxylase-like metal-dependent hydrolase (beta-lactamase superfamily II)